jgi:hypothetical protein
MHGHGSFTIYVSLPHSPKSIQILYISSIKTHFINKYISVVYSLIYYTKEKLKFLYQYLGRMEQTVYTLG